ncbi:unnamed protein product [Rotaria sp. Silwood1]|nr:unnamed protein product [Rotaria sp. Silwood1]
MTILEIELPLLMSTQLGQPTLTTDSNLQWTNNNKNQIEKSDDQGSEENQNSSTAPGGGSINREFLTIDTSSRKVIRGQSGVWITTPVHLNL